MKVLVNVVDVEMQRNGRHSCDGGNGRPGVVDLCELSKDFVGTLQRSLGISLRSGESLSNVRLVLKANDGHKVVNRRSGSTVCKLSVRGGEAGIHFSASRFLSVKSGSPITSNFKGDVVDSMDLGRAGVVCELGSEH